MAFAVTAYNDDEENGTLVDESYGRLKASQKVWGERDENDKLKPTYFRELQLEPCRRIDFTLGDEEDVPTLARFYEPG